MQLRDERDKISVKQQNDKRYKKRSKNRNRFKKKESA